MSKKPRFVIPSNVQQSLNETIHLVEEYEGIYSDTLIALDRIVLDLDNPRQLNLKREDLLNGPSREDPLYREKLEELASLTQLANSIKNEGIIHPVVVYKIDNLYKLVAGERRCLASIIAQKKSIEARVFNKKPSIFKLKLIQWAENNSREDLSLWQRMMNMKNIVDAYKGEYQKGEVSSSEISQLTSLSRSQVTAYLAIIHSPEDVMAAIQMGKITNLDKAAAIAKIQEKSSREVAIQACVTGVALNAIRQLSAKQSMVVPHQNVKGRGRQATRINMGFTHKPRVAKFVANAVLANPLFANYNKLFNAVNWDDFREASKALQNLINLLEKLEVIAQ